MLYTCTMARKSFFLKGNSWDLLTFLLTCPFFSPQVNEDKSSLPVVSTNPAVPSSMDMLRSQMAKLRESREQKGSENVKPHSPPRDINELRARLEKIKASLRWCAHFWTFWMFPVFVLRLPLLQLTFLHVTVFTCIFLYIFELLSCSRFFNNGFHLNVLTDAFTCAFSQWWNKGDFSWF